jgi:hypothetical protein
VALTLTGVAHRLREVIAALDRRIPRVGDPREAAGVRDAAALREDAGRGLVDLAGRTRPVAPVSKTTAFPATPDAVSALAIQEFAFDLDDLVGQRVPSLERVCGSFADDANRALVWCIRFGALKNWSGRVGVLARLTADPSAFRDAREAAAGCPLNPRWEFDPEDFGSAIEAVAVRRAAG